MIQHGILDLDAIYDMLGPEDSLIQENAEKDISEAREFIRKMNIVSTKDKDENEDKQQENEVDDDIKVRRIGRLMSLLGTNFHKLPNNQHILLDNRWNNFCLIFPIVCVESKIWSAGSTVTSRRLATC